MSAVTSMNKPIPTARSRFPVLAICWITLSIVAVAVAVFFFN